MDRKTIEVSPRDKSIKRDEVKLTSRDDDTHMPPSRTRKAEILNKVIEKKEPRMDKVLFEKVVAIIEAKKKDRMTAVSKDKTVVDHKPTTKDVQKEEAEQVDEKKAKAEVEKAEAKKNHKSDWKKEVGYMKAEDTAFTPEELAFIEQEMAEATKGVDAQEKQSNSDMAKAAKDQMRDKIKEKQHREKAKNAEQKKNEINRMKDQVAQMNSFTPEVAGSLIESINKIVGR